MPAVSGPLAAVSAGPETIQSGPFTPTLPINMANMVKVAVAFKLTEYLLGGYWPFLGCGLLHAAALRGVRTSRSTSSLSFRVGLSSFFFLKGHCLQAELIVVD
jgi:hypothetical protein